MYGLAKSQACTKGNKRAATILVWFFVEMNQGHFVVDSLVLSRKIEQVAATEEADRSSVLADAEVWVGQSIVWGVP